MSKRKRARTTPTLKARTPVGVLSQVITHLDNCYSPNVTDTVLETPKTTQKELGFNEEN